MKMTRSMVTAVVLALSVAAYATTGTISAHHSAYGAKDTIKVWGGGLTKASAQAGIYMLRTDSGTGEGQFWENSYIGAFCIDLSEWAPNKPVTYDVILPQEGPRPTTFLGGPMGGQKAEYLKELWGRYYDSAWAEDGPYTKQQKESAGAFAAAIWEIVYEDLPSSPVNWNVTMDGTSGSRGFYCENADATTANNWLHSLNGAGPKADLRVLSYNGVQDFLVQAPANVPEPATVIILGLGGAFLMRRRPEFIVGRLN